MTAPPILNCLYSNFWYMQMNLVFYPDGDDDDGDNNEDNDPEEDNNDADN